MKRYIKVLLISFTLLLFSLNAYALTAEGFNGYDYYTYYGTTADNIKIAWDAGADFNSTTDTYEMALHNPERDITVNVIADLVDNFFTIKCPKTGHWVPRVRTKRIKDDGTFEYSEWSVSTDETVAKVDGVLKGWWIFTWIASTGPITGDQRTIFLKNNK